MERFDSIEEKVIFEKLTSNTNQISTNKNILEGNKDIFDSNKISDYFLEINNHINTLEQTRQNFAYREITSHRKLIGRLIVLGKKVVRKFLKFYIEPITYQQTEFNNAVTPIVGRMTEIQADLLQNIVLLKTENTDLKSKLDSEVLKLEESLGSKINEALKIQEIANKQIEIDQEQSNKRILEFEKSLDAKINNALKLQAVANNQIKTNQEKLNLLDELEIDVFKETEFNFWDKKTVSQSGEDTICAYINMVMGRNLDQCTYLDLGANHAKDLSNTYLFYSQGARGVLVEANPELIPELKFYRNGDVILNKCVAAQSGDYVDFYILNGDGLSTTDLDAANKAIAQNPALEIVDTIKVETITVNEIMEDYLGKAPVIMNIDIEGKDMEILESIDFEKYRPFIIITEMIEYSTTLVIGKKNNEIIKYMESKGYSEYAFTGINSIFIDQTQI